MATLNQVQLIGNAGGDPEVRYIGDQASASKVAQFSLATQETYTDRQGQRQQLAEWHRVVAFRALADVAEKYIRKGSQLYIEGRLRTRQWNDQTGAKRQVTEVVAGNIQLLGSRPSAAGQQQTSPASAYQQPVQMQQADPGSEEQTDDLPF